ncbi:MAG: hypothetical protein OXU35_06870 [Acidobacteriota bacterium]|nr:hypothetical protein [Acidobacteriota bacterium]
MKHVSLRSRFMAAGAVAALVLASPLAVPAHAHPDQTDNPCGICKVAATGAPALEGGPELPFPRHESKLGAPVVPFATAEPAATPAAPRAPPS